VLPTIASDSNYISIGDTQDDGMAMDASRDGIHPTTAQTEKAHIESDLLKYCGLDAYA
jgi:hypothetical protein